MPSASRKPSVIPNLQPAFEPTVNVNHAATLQELKSVCKELHIQQHLLYGCVRELREYVHQIGDTLYRKIDHHEKTLQTRLYEDGKSTRTAIETLTEDLIEAAQVYGRELFQTAEVASSPQFPRQPIGLGISQVTSSEVTREERTPKTNPSRSPQLSEAKNKPTQSPKLRINA